jgi:hypothetical protein
MTGQEFHRQILDEKKDAQEHLPVRKMLCLFGTANKERNTLVINP